MWKKAELRIPKKLRRDAGAWLPKNKNQMQEVGQLAIDMIRGRILKEQRDGTGTRLPKLEANGWFWTSVNDTRFGGHLKRASWTGELTDKKITRREVILTHKDGYGSLKQKMTGKRSKRKDGNLTGDMWKGFSQLLKKVRGGWAIKLHFIGGTRVGKVKGWGNKTVKRINRDTNKVEVVKIKVPKMKTVTLRNRDKAQGIQERSGSPVAALLSMTADEVTACMDLYASLIKPFGEQTNSRLQGFSTKMFRKGRTL
tara:strand:+ start:198 stop:962 length:765 start_codon:yes stop_codon:yes gene_type:complete